MRSFSFEIRHKDINARIGRLAINGKTIETPAIMPVLNPFNQVVSAGEMKRLFGTKVLMTNAYTLLKKKGEVSKSGIHRFLKFNGTIATDSGSFQLMNYGKVDTTNGEIIKFQEKMGSDIGSFLDIPSLPDGYKPVVERQLGETLRRAGEAKNAGFLVNAGIQGGNYLDLRARAAKSIGKDFSLVAIGGIVPLMESYRFAELIDIIAVARKNLPADRVVHAFGMGHPMVFSLAVALGVDLFDSAAYYLFAKDGRYLTVEGTKKLEELEHFSCTCPVCLKHGRELKELPPGERVKKLSLHNLYVTFSEIERVKQAIRENSLWELIAVRCRAHPDLFSGFKQFLKHGRWLAKSDLITKRSAFYDTGFESRRRTEVINARARIKRVESRKQVKIGPFGKVPAAILDIYPFGSSGEESGAKDLEKVRAIMDYQFGKEAGTLIDNSARIKKSRKTGRIRWIYSKKEMIASVRASDHFIIPKMPLAKRLHEKFKSPRLRVTFGDDDEVVKCVMEGRSVFAKFVKSVDKDLRAGDEVLVVDSNDWLIATGTLVLSPDEAMDFGRGVAVNVR